MIARLRAFLVRMRTIPHIDPEPIDVAARWAALMGEDPE
jgi:hypothetical protein